MYILDIAKAFDSKSHDLLLHKLKIIIGNNTIWYWFKSYLLNRPQTTGINVIISDSCTAIDYSAKTYLFTIYVNYLFNLDIDGKILAFTNDTALFFEGDSWTQVEKKCL